MKYGFVYIWRDRKHNRYYIGSHWGTEDDGYICSSSWMLKGYRRRPQDFRRRILSIVNTNRYDLFEKEQDWLNLINESEIKSRYYNLRLTTKNHWLADEERTLSVKEKIKKNHWSRDSVKSAKVRKKLSESAQGREPPNKGIPMSEKQKKLLSDRTKGRPSYERTEKTRKKISENSKRLQKEGKIGMCGKKHTEETKRKMSKNNAMNNPESVEKIRKSREGMIWFIKDGKRKWAVPNTDKWNNLVATGYEVI